MKKATLERYRKGYMGMLKVQRDHAEQQAKFHKQEAARLRASFADLLYSISEPIPEEKIFSVGVVDGKFINL